MKYDVLGITGHRPDKLFGYDMRRPEYENMRKSFQKLILELHVERIVCGGALGADLLFLEAAVQLNQMLKSAMASDENLTGPVRLTEIVIAAPFPGYDSRWKKADREKLAELQKHCETIYISDFYTPYAYQKRNEYIVDVSDIILAVWDGSPSGTKNCVEYAQKRRKPIIISRPEYFTM